ncbi:MAG: hypothetical protein AAGE94_26035, partial [Acidobacteriota bacterium]
VVERLDAARSSYRSMRYRGPTPDFETVRRPAWGLRWAPVAAGLAAASIALVVSLIVMRDTTIRTRPVVTAPPPIERAGSVEPTLPIAPPASDHAVEHQNESVAPAEPAGPRPDASASAETASPETASPETESPETVELPDDAASPSFRPRWTGPSASAGLGTIHRGLGRPTAPPRPLALTLRVPTRPTAPDDRR